MHILKMVVKFCTNSRLLCFKKMYWFRENSNFPFSNQKIITLQEKFRGSGNLPLLSTVFFFPQITLTNRIYLYNTHVFWLIQFHINVTLFDNILFHYYFEDLEILVRTIYCFIYRFKAFIFLQNYYYVYVYIYSKEELPSWNKKKIVTY